MRIPKILALGAMTLTMSLGVASAAHAADYPPTTVSQHTLGSTVSTPTTAAAATEHAAAAAPASDGLPFTGGDSAGLVWLGVAAIGTGSFAAWRFRRRPHAS